MSEKPTYQELQMRIKSLENELADCRKANPFQGIGSDPESSKLLLSALWHGPFRMSIKNLDGRYIMANKKFCADLNLSQSDVLGKTVRDLFPDERVEVFIDEDRTVIQTQNSVTHSDRVGSTNDNNYFNTKKFPVFDEDGKVAATCAISTDITDLIVEEDNLRRTKERFWLVFKTSPDAIVLSKPDGTIIDVNDGFSSLTGFAYDEAVGRNIYDINTWNDVHDRRKLVEELEVFGYVKNQEFNFKRKDGILEVGLLSARRFSLEGEDIIVSITRSISDRKVAEQALRDSEKRFRDLAEMLPAAVIESDRNLLIAYANQRLFELFGYSRQELYAIDNLDLLVEEDRQRVKSNMALIKDGRQLGPIEYQALRKDGSTFPALINVNAILSPDGFSGFRCTIIDLTTFKKIQEEKALIEAQFIQSQKVEAIGRLAGGIAHDLNNMLSPIIGFAELLMFQSTFEAKQRDALDQILRAGHKARDLVHQLLAFSRKQDLEYKSINLNHIVTGFEKLLRRTIRENIKIDIAPVSAIATTMADMGQIEQVIMNLCINAQDAMPDGGTLTLETAMTELDESYARLHSAVQPGTYVMLAVSDTGAGIDQSIQDQIFEPFFSTKGAQGTGLGLATVYGIVKQHGGNIWVYSEPGQGTTFKIFLPVSEVSPTNPEKEPETITDTQGNETILIVEDNDMVRHLTDEILRPLGYSILMAQNATEALAVAASHPHPIDLVLTDVIMPDMDGKTMFTKLSELFPKAEVLYMSGYTNEIIAHLGVLNKGVRFIQKPFTVQGLAKKVREALASR